MAYSSCPAHFSNNTVSSPPEFPCLTRFPQRSSPGLRLLAGCDLCSPRAFALTSALRHDPHLTVPVTFSGTPVAGESHLLPALFSPPPLPSSTFDHQIRYGLCISSSASCFLLKGSPQHHSLGTCMIKCPINVYKCLQPIVFLLGLNLTHKLAVSWYVVFFFATLHLFLY